MSGHSPGVGRPRKTRRDDARAAIREDAEARVRGEFDLVPTASTDAQGAPASVLGHGRPLRNMSEVRHFFRTNTTPIYFVGATPFNLLGLDRWVRNFTYITYYDGWDGVHPRVFSPSYKPYIEFESGEEINSWLLTNAEVRAHIASRTVPGVRPKIVMVFCDAEVERICDELGYDLILPSTELREHLDSKLGQARDDGPLRSDRHSARPTGHPRAGSPRWRQALYGGTPWGTAPVPSTSSSPEASPPRSARALPPPAWAICSRRGGFTSSCRSSTPI